MNNNLLPLSIFAYSYLFIINRVAYYINTEAVIDAVNIPLYSYRFVRIYVDEQYTKVNLYGEHNYINTQCSITFIKKLMRHFSIYHSREKFTQFMRREGYCWDSTRSITELL